MKILIIHRHPNNSDSYRIGEGNFFQKGQGVLADAIIEAIETSDHFDHLQWNLGFMVWPNGTSKEEL